MIVVDFSTYFTQVACLAGWIFLCAGVYTAVEMLVGKTTPPFDPNNPTP